MSERGLNRLSLDSLHMSDMRLNRWQYAEMRALCRQYYDLRREANLLLGPRGQNMDPTPHGDGTHGDPVAAAADARARYLAKVDMIDRARYMIGGGLWAEALRLNACDGVSYDHIPQTLLPTSVRWDFFKARRAFFWALYELACGRDPERIV